MTLKVVQLKESNFRDPVTTLRNMADAIERGEYDVDVVTYVVQEKGSKMPRVFSAGRESDQAEVVLSLHKALSIVVGG